MAGAGLSWACAGLLGGLVGGSLLGGGPRSWSAPRSALGPFGLRPARGLPRVRAACRRLRLSLSAPLAVPPSLAGPPAWARLSSSWGLCPWVSVFGPWAPLFALVLCGGCGGHYSDVVFLVLYPQPCVQIFRTGAPSLIFCAFLLLQALLIFLGMRLCPCTVFRR